MNVTKLFQCRSELMSLRTLTILQAAYAFLAIGYLLLSFWRLQATGEALSAAPAGPAIAMLSVYLLALLLPHYGYLRGYQVAMLVFLVLVCGGGVIGNIARYLDSGLEHYVSFIAFACAVAINAFGSVLNVLAVFGWYSRPTQTV